MNSRSCSGFGTSLNQLLHRDSQKLSTRLNIRFAKFEGWILHAPRYAHVWGKYFHSFLTTALDGIEWWIYLISGKQPTVSIGWEAGWVTEPAWVIWWRENFSAPRKSKLYTSASSLRVPAVDLTLLLVGCATNQRTNQLTDQPTNEPTNQRKNQPTTRSRLSWKADSPSANTEIPFFLSYSDFFHQLIVGEEVRFIVEPVTMNDTHHIRQNSSGRGISPTQRPLPVQHTTLYKRHPCLRRDSNPQSQQANGRRPHALDCSGTGISPYFFSV
jgi:hypothetical protein